MTKGFKPFDISWIEIGALHSNWNKCTSSFIKDTRCCGFTRLHLQRTHFSVILNTFGIVVGANTVWLFKHYLSWPRIFWD